MIYSRKSVLPIIIAAVLVFPAVYSQANTLTSSEILRRVKFAEKGFDDFTAIMESHAYDSAGKDAEISKIQTAKILYKAPDKYRKEASVNGTLSINIQNGSIRINVTPIATNKEDQRNQPQKLLNSLDLGFLSSQLWEDFNVTLTPTKQERIVQIKFTPKESTSNGYYEIAWVDIKTLRLIKRYKFTSDESQSGMQYEDYKVLGRELPIATKITILGQNGNRLGVRFYKKLNVNVGLKDSLFTAPAS